MPSYTVITRVELHKDDARKQPHSPTAPEYDTLHAEMHDRGYRRFYDGVSGKMRKLPPGEYRISVTAGDEDAARDFALAKAKEAATIATSEKRFSLLVTPGDFTGYHLPVIAKDPDE